ncbi:MAG: redoxin domain-containing protein, partial [Fimbriimonadaceae bacterium]|nr:redoxin domain-containing protein [Fimbriimonadaceae bacterium]
LAVSTALCQDDPGFGHSHHGSAFDSGMRTKPWKIEGIGTAPFPISTKNAELQSWYDQGNALLHSFWFEEAERSFRWCLKMEPENAMVYFGLARCGLSWFTIGSGDDPSLTRFRDFLKEAVKRKGTVTERERLYIEAWDAAWSKTGEESTKEIVQRLQKLCVLYPNDIEAKAQLAFFNIGQGSQLANEFLIQQILAVNPMHPGAHHARIHTWDDVDSAQAVASCELYGKAAPGIGHALHMPGHIYSKIGMWHEAAIAMDSATRVELKYMNDRLALPFENWNYPHNRDYLCYIQEQLGRAEDSIRGARDIMRSPKDPGNFVSGYPAVLALTRALLKFERWDEILDEKTFPAAENPIEALTVGAAKVIALAELGRTREAREALKGVQEEPKKQLEAMIAKNPDKADEIRKEAGAFAPLLLKTAEAKVLLAEGKRLNGIRLLLEQAEKERLDREAHNYRNDPPFDPWPIMRLVGDAYAAGGDLTSAIEAYETALAQEPNDAWCLAGLAKSFAARGDAASAKRYAGRFLAVWSGADRNLRWTKEVLALGLNATPKAETMKPERVYVPAALDPIGPSNWQPFPAPSLDCVDMELNPVKLSDYRGQNVLLVFYLSDQCVHCMEQLGKINERLGEFSDANTVVLGVSATSPQANKDSVTLAPFKVKLLSDVDHSNARRFSSYDDFEDLELHATILIDADGKVRWKRTGGDPFDDVDFLLGEIKRWGLPG